jgi:hypothetical protein
MRVRLLVISILFLAASICWGIGKYSANRLQSDYRLLDLPIPLQTGTIVKGEFPASISGKHYLELQYPKGVSSSTAELDRQDLSARFSLSAKTGAVVDGHIPPIRRVASNGKTITILMLAFDVTEKTNYSYLFQLVSAPVAFTSTGARLLVEISPYEYGLSRALELFGLIFLTLGLLIWLAYALRDWRERRNTRRELGSGCKY